MMLIEIDCALLSSKQELLQSLSQFFDEMYAPNYDALIDAASTYEDSLTIEILNVNQFENAKDLLEVMEIIAKDNSNITVKVK